VFTLTEPNYDDILLRNICLMFVVQEVYVAGVALQVTFHRVMRTVIVAGEFVCFVLGILERTFLGVKAEEIRFALEGAPEASRSTSLAPLLEVGYAETAMPRE
jgi:hypothetical protein